MALIKCDECGKDISDKAKLCVNCGAPINNISNDENIKEISSNSQSKTDEEIIEMMSNKDKEKYFLNKKKCKKIFLLYPLAFISLLISAVLFAVGNYMFAIIFLIPLLVEIYLLIFKVIPLRRQNKNILASYDDTRDKQVESVFIFNNRNLSSIIIVVVALVGILYLNIFVFNDNSDETNTAKIIGCYNVEENTTVLNVSLCFSKNDVEVSIGTSSYNLYYDWVFDELYIKNEYDDNMFICDVSSEDSNKMQCTSYNNIIGYDRLKFIKE